MPVQPIPHDHPRVTPYLVVPGVARLIDFLKDAFGAEEIGRWPGPSGAIMHAEVRIVDSRVMMGEPPEGAEPVPACLHFCVEDVDAIYRRALAAGAVSLREPADQFYGDRTAGVKDPSGNSWWLTTHVEDVTPEEMARRQEALARGEPWQRD
jgi:PhnB protein